MWEAYDINTIYTCVRFGLWVNVYVYLYMNVNWHLAKIACACGGALVVTVDFSISVHNKLNKFIKNTLTHPHINVGIKIARPYYIHYFALVLFVYITNICSLSLTLPNGNNQFDHLIFPVIVFPFVVFDFVNSIHIAQVYIPFIFEMGRNSNQMNRTEMYVAELVEKNSAL